MKGLNISPLPFVNQGGSAAEVKAMGYDAIRIHMYMNDSYHLNPPAVETIIADCAAHGVDVIFNIRNDAQDYAAVENEWLGIIDKYDHRAIVKGYDLMNEPKDLEDDGVTLWHEYLHGMVKRLRALTQKPFIIEAGKGPTSTGFATLKPVNDDNIIYSSHIYWPYPFTHQGIKGKPIGFKWPGSYYDADRTRDDIVKQDVQPLIDFQNKYNVPVLIGEMGVSVYAEETSARRWMEDVKGICAQYGWDYFIHSYPEADFRLL